MSNQFKVIRPLSALCEHILDTNLTQEYGIYDESVTYAKGDLVIIDNCGSEVYESLVNSNVGNHPSESPLDWLYVGVSNYFAMFDDKNTTQTKAIDVIDYTVEFVDTVDSLALVNLTNVTSITFQVWRNDVDYQTDPPTVEQTFNLRDYGTSTWYEWRTYQVKSRDRFIKFDLGIFLGGVGRIILNGSGEIGIGSIVYGESKDLGLAINPINWRIKDYSFKTVDEFGERTIIERDFKDVMDCNVIVENSNRQEIRKLINAYRAKPLVWAANPADDSAIINGFWNRADFNSSDSATTRLTLEIEEL